VNTTVALSQTLPFCVSKGYRPYGAEAPQQSVPNTFESWSGRELAGHHSSRLRIPLTM